MKLFALVAAALISGGCSSDLPASSFIAKLRLLAVQAEPPELAPGQTTTLTALVAEPPVPPDGGVAAELSFVWLACTQLPNSNVDAPCGLSASAPLPGASMNQSALPPFCKDQPDAPLCVLRVGGKEAATATYTPPASVLAGARTTQVMIGVTVADSIEGATGCLLDAANNNDIPQDKDHCILGLKRVVVTDPTQPLSDGSLPVFNHNPTLADVTMNVPMGAAMELDGTARFAPSPEGNASPPELELHATRAADAAETEPTLDASGKVTGAQVEALTLAWFTSAGTLDGGRSAYAPAGCLDQQSCPTEQPTLDAMTKWQPPTPSELSMTSPDDQTVQFWVVIRDDRGGVSWKQGSARAQ